MNIDIINQSIEVYFSNPTFVIGTGAGGSSTWGDITGTLSNQTDLQNALNAKQDTLVSGTNIKTINNVSLLGSGDIVISGTGAVDSVNGQTGIVILDADDISDTTTTNKFVTASELTDIGLNTADRHVAVTVTDSSEINFTLTGQNITGSIVSGSIDETKLDTSVNASLDKADTSLQPSAIGTTVQAHNSVLDATTASFTLADEAKLDGIEAGADVTDTANVTSAGAVMKSSYTPAHSLLVQQSGTGTPTSLSVSNNSFVGKTTGDIVSLSAIQARTILNVEDGAEVNNISDVNATDLTDGGNTALHIHDDRYYTESEADSLLGAKQDTLISGTNIKTINSISILGSGDIVISGSGAVDSVNGQTGVVVLDADDIDDTTTTNKFVTAGDLTTLSNTSGTNTGDVTVTDSSEIDFTLTGQNITASIIGGSIDETKLDTSVNASLTLANSSLQSAAIGTTVQAYSANLDGFSTKVAPAGTVIGSSDTQTLTNKSISGSTNTITNIAQSSVTNLVTDLSSKVNTTRLISAGTGISGGGDLSANRTLSLDINGLTTENNITIANDTIAFFDASANVIRKVTISELFKKQDNYSFLALMGSNQIMTPDSFSYTTIQFNNDSSNGAYDNGSMFNTTTHMCTAPVNGLYQFSGITRENNISGGANHFVSNVYYKGASFLAMGAQFGVNSTSLVGDVYYTFATLQVPLVAGDTISMRYRLGTGATGTLVGGPLSENSFFTGRLLHAT